MKPILFNTDMVRAILAGRKTVTRRVVKLKYSNTHLEMRTDKYGTRLIEIENEIPGVTRVNNPDGTITLKVRAFIDRMPPYRPGDILYVREAFCRQPSEEYPFVYKASMEVPAAWKWRPSIHMPRDAARIFLRVTGVRVDRLQDITEEQAEREGCTAGRIEVTGGPWGIEDDPDEWTARESFVDVWNSTVKKSDRALYGW